MSANKQHKNLTTIFDPSNEFLSKIGLLVGLLHHCITNEVIPTQIQSAVSICEFLCPGMVLYSISVDYGCTEEPHTLIPRVRKVVWVLVRWGCEIESGVAEMDVIRCRGSCGT